MLLTIQNSLENLIKDNISKCSRACDAMHHECKQKQQVTMSHYYSNDQINICVNLWNVSKTNMKKRFRYY